MAIGFRASSAAGATSSSQVSSQAITIPAAVAAGDVLVIGGIQVPISATVGTLSIASTGTAPVSAAAEVSASESLPATLAAEPWTVVCGAGDAGKVITVSSTTTGFWSVAVAAYTGVDNTTPVDVAPAGAVTAGGNTGTVTCPAGSTVTAGDWAVYVGGGAAEGTTLTPPSGSTSRESSVASGIDVYAVIADGNASAGASGTSIGGGTFTTNVSSNSILAAFTLGLKPAGSGTPHAGTATLSGSGSLGVSRVVTQPAAAALSGSGSLGAAASVTGVESASLSGSGSLGTRPAVAFKAAAALSGFGALAAGPAVTFSSAAPLTGSGSLTVAGTVTSPFSAVFGSTDGNGVQAWTVTSAFNGPSTSVLRILPPTSGSGSYPHSFCFMLPVSTGTDATYGDPITVAEDLSAPNAYNTTVVVPSFPIEPWYADNPGNAQQSQESFMLALAAWMSTSSFASGGEKNYLVGFSKSGIGGQGLIFHRPDVWAACASWDAPFMMTDYDGTDPTLGQTVGGDPSDCYGTSANFTTNYELSSGHLATWAPGGGFAVRERLWIGGYYAFQADVSAYMSLLTSAGILYNGTLEAADVSHAWHDDWVSDALAAIMAMPAEQPAVTLSGAGTLTAGGLAVRPAAAALSGSGALRAAAAVQLRAAAALTGTGALTTAALAAQPAAAALSGTGSLGAAETAQFTAPAALAGSGSLTAGGVVSQPVSAGLAGSGSLTAGMIEQLAVAAALSGSGALTAAGTASGLVTGSASLAGSGSLTATVSLVLPQAAALSGSGAFAAAVLVGVTGGAALTGTGLLLAASAVTLPASSSLSGQGMLSVSAVLSGGASTALSGTGSLAAGLVLALAASAALAGSGSLTVSVQLTSPVTEPSIAWSVGPAAPRWNCRPSLPRWRVVMAVFLPVSALSLECVNVTWQSGLDGTAVDPTGQTENQPELPVYFAFPPTSGNYQEPAEPSTWYPASWLQGGTGTGYLAQCLVGPGGGVVTLTAGQAFDVWAKVSGSPESPVKFAGTQAVF